MTTLVCYPTLPLPLPTTIDVPTVLLSAALYYSANAAAVLAVLCHTAAAAVTAASKTVSALFRLKPAVESCWQRHYSCSAAAPLDVLNYFALLCSAQLQYSGNHWQ
jgi:hypothetical protein